MEVAGEIPQCHAGAVTDRPQRDSGHHFPALHAVFAWSGGEHHEWRLNHQDDLGRRSDDRHRVYSAGSHLHAAGLVFGHDHHPNGFYVGGDKLDHGFDRDRDEHGIKRVNREHDRGWVHDWGGCNYNGYWVNDRVGHHGGYWVGREFDHGNRHGFISFHYPVIDHGRAT